MWICLNTKINNKKIIIILAIFYEKWLSVVDLCAILNSRGAKMFSAGKFNHQLDQKNRLRIPFRLKASLGNDFVIMRGTRGCLFVFSAEQFADFYNKVGQVPMSDSREQDALTRLFSAVSYPEEDNQGRFVLDADMRKLAKIQKNVVFVGFPNRIELWAEEVYESRYTEMSTEEYDEAFETLGKYGI